MSLALAISEAVAARAKEVKETQGRWLRGQVLSEHAAGIVQWCVDAEVKRYERDKALMVDAEEIRDRLHVEFVARTFQPKRNAA